MQTTNVLRGGCYWFGDPALADIGGAEKVESRRVVYEVVSRNRPRINPS